MRGLPEELRRLRDESVSPLASIHESLETLGVPEGNGNAFIAATLLALRGWARDDAADRAPRRPRRASGAIGEPGRVPGGAVAPGSFALAYTARDGTRLRWPLERAASDGCETHPTELAAQRRATGVSDFPVGADPRLVAGRSVTVSAEAMEHADRGDRDLLGAGAPADLSPGLRAAVLQADAGRRVAARATPRPRRRKPRFQAMFCIDEREESIRRHIEELAPDAATFSTAGFYSIAMYYRGAADAHFVPLCPAVIRPQHWVVEHVVESHEKEYRRQAKTRRALGMATHQFHRGSRTLRGRRRAVGGRRGSGVDSARRPHAFPAVDFSDPAHFGRYMVTPPLTRLRLERERRRPRARDGAQSVSASTK